MSNLFLGMISGTSIDGVDAVLAEIGDNDFRIVGANTTPFPADLHARLRKLVETPETSLREKTSPRSAVTGKRSTTSHSAPSLSACSSAIRT
jgi:1,6-anhydro-N-acetylmuramate kinase